MPDGRAARFALEAAFLVAVAAVAAVGDLRRLWIVVAMVVAWAIVALLEWFAWRERPHWASGMPPRYYVPPEPRLPRPPGTELPAFTSYPRPEPREADAPTWIGTPEMRAEMLGWSDPDPAGSEPKTTAGEPRVELPDGAELAGAEAGWPVAYEHVRAAGDPWVVMELPVEPEPAPEPEPEPVAAPGPEPVAGTEPAAEPGRPAAAEPLAPPGPAAVPELAAELEQPSHSRVVRHRIDPFQQSSGRRWPWTRRAEESAAVAELPPLPRHVRVLTPEEEQLGAGEPD